MCRHIIKNISRLSKARKPSKVKTDRKHLIKQMEHAKTSKPPSFGPSLNLEKMLEMEQESRKQSLFPVD